MDIRLAWRRALRKLRTTGFRNTAVEVCRGVGELLGLFDTVNAFDLEFRTDTGGVVPLWKFRLKSPNALFGTKYQPSDAQEIRDAVSYLGEVPQDFAFVDLGCGKGRALLVAAKLGFSQIIGVELVPTLAVIAAENLAQMKVSNAVVVQIDAAEYTFPDVDTVVYLYDPFSIEVMGKVISKLRQSKARRLFVIYNDPNCASLFEECRFFAHLGHPPGRPTVRVWKALTSRPQPATRKDLKGVDGERKHTGDLVSIE